MEIRLTVEYKIKPEHFESVIVGALEGGSNYWYLLKGFGDLSGADTDKNEAISIRIARELYRNSLYSLEVFDIENPEDEALGTISQATLLRAFTDNPELLDDIINEQDDAYTADALFQYAVMGEITFG